jgi:glyoxylase-like metal-dependent hydrolase (beta-lactamase superfamily II)
MPATLRVVQLAVGAFASNCYLAWGEGRRDALVVDPGDEPDTVLAELRRLGLSAAAYLVTHGHVDHVHALAAVHDGMPAPVFMNPADVRWAFGPLNAIPPYDAPRRPRTEIRPVAGGDEFGAGGFSIRVLDAPGHSPGSVVFHVPAERAAFCGDVLFRGSIGRTDLPGGDAPALLASLDRLCALPRETTLYPGHGPATTIAEELATNPFLLDRSWAE